MTTPIIKAERVIILACDNPTCTTTQWQESCYDDRRCPTCTLTGRAIASINSGQYLTLTPTNPDAT